MDPMSSLLNLMAIFWSDCPIELFKSPKLLLVEIRRQFSVDDLDRFGPTTGIILCQVKVTCFLVPVSGKELHIAFPFVSRYTILFDIGFKTSSAVGIDSLLLYLLIDRR